MTVILTAFGICMLTQAQFKHSKNSWGLTAGGVHGTNSVNNEWGMRDVSVYRL